MTVGVRLKRLEKRLGVGRPVHDDDGEYDLVPIADWVESMRDVRELMEEMARYGDHRRRMHEEWLPLFEVDEAEAARIGVGGVYRRRRLSDAAEAQLDKLREGFAPEFDRRKVERRSRREPWPAPFRSWLEPEGVV
jgi:hypothetical protein